MSQAEVLTESTLTVSKQNSALVSVGMAVYNEERHLRNTLDSVLAQDYGNFEIIISNNASTDGTELICKEYLLRDERIRYYRNETNLGSLPNFNRVFELAGGELFMWASGHDSYHKSFMTRCAAPLLEDSSIVLCHPQAFWIDVNGQQLELIPDSLSTRGVLSQLLRLNMVLWRLSSTSFPFYGMIRTRTLKQTALMQQGVAASDFTLLVELSLLGTFAHIPEPLFYVRKPLDWGSWRRYVEKHFKHKGGGWSAQLLFWRMLRGMISGVMRHVDSFFGRVVGIVLVLLCVFLKYHWILLGLLSIRKPRRED